MEKDKELKQDPVAFIENFNNSVGSMPLDYALSQEIFKAIFAFMVVSKRSYLYKQLFNKFSSILDSSDDPFIFTRKLSEVKLSDFLNEEDIKTFYYLSIPEPSIPADDALQNSEEA